MSTEEMIKELQINIAKLKKEILEKESIITELTEKLKNSNENE